MIQKFHFEYILKIIESRILDRYLAALFIIACTSIRPLLVLFIVIKIPRLACLIFPSWRSLQFILAMNKTLAF